MLAEDGVVSKLKRAIDEDAAEEWAEDAMARMDAEMTLLSGLLKTCSGP